LEEEEAELTLEIPFIRMRQIEGLETMVAAFTTDNSCAQPVG
jgi:hypothetical protein